MQLLQEAHRNYPGQGQGVGAHHSTLSQTNVPQPVRYSPTWASMPVCLHGHSSKGPKCHSQGDTLHLETYRELCPSHNLPVPGPRGTPSGPLASTQTGGLQ